MIPKGKLFLGVFLLTSLLNKFTIKLIFILNPPYHTPLSGLHSMAGDNSHPWFHKTKNKKQLHFQRFMHHRAKELLSFNSHRSIISLCLYFCLFLSIYLSFFLSFYLSLFQCLLVCLSVLYDTQQKAESIKTT